MVLSTDIRDKKEVFKKFNNYMAEHPSYTREFLKTQGMTPAEIKALQAKNIEERQSVLKQRRDTRGITSFRPMKRGGKVLANSTRKAKYKAG